MERAIEPLGAEALLSSFPSGDFWLLRHDDGEKAYSYAARPLVTLGSDRIAPLGPLAPAWEELASDLLSGSYRDALCQLLGRSLDGALMEASVWRWDADAHLGPHRDLADKIVTQVFYLSTRWDPEWGGCLRILRSSRPDDVVAELPPMNGTASVLVRSERSWHSVSPVRGAAPEPRRSVIVTWFRAGSTSPVWRLGEDGRVECVSAGKVREPAQEPASVEGASSDAAPRSPAPRALDRPAARRALGDAPSAASSRAGARGRDATVTPRPARAALADLSSPPTTRVAMVGTFDVGNFGDLLLPLIAARELGERLGTEYEPTLYSYRPMSGAAWPHEVRDLALLPLEIARFDLLLVGGGQIVRFDRRLPRGYLPSDPSVHHPLGLWLTPALLAAAVGVPMAWNAPGVAADIPAWLDPLIEVAVRAAAHIAVRDDVSAGILSSHVAAPVRVVPDTGFGVLAALPEAPSRACTTLLHELGAQDGYVVLQPSPELQGVERAVRQVVDAARAQGLAVLELPLSPVLGDRPGVLGALGPTVTPQTWPSPLLIAELLARARAVVAQSYHAGVVAIAAGAPLYRPKSPPGWKYEALEGLAGVHTLDDDPRSRAMTWSFEPAPPGLAARERVAQLANHWDCVAAAAKTGKQQAPSAWAMSLIAGLPRLLNAREDAMHECEQAADARARALEDQLATCQVAGSAATARIGALETDLASLLARRDELSAQVAARDAELVALEARRAALEEVRNRKVVRLGLTLARPLALLRQRLGRHADAGSQRSREDG